MLLIAILFNLFSFSHQNHADSTLRVKKIIIEGNYRTKEGIILRELDFKENDTLSEASLQKRLEINRRKIFNTSLFNFVEIKHQKDSTEHGIHIKIQVQEQWYIFGYPVMDIADRNFSDWWQRGHSFDRINYGINIIHSNVRGRAERLSLLLVSGFTQRLGLSYRFPYIDKAKKTGLGIAVGYNTNNTLAYTTKSDNLVYLKTEGILRERFTASVSVRKRYKFYDFHTVELTYNVNRIADTVARLNPRYFNDGQTNQQYAMISYGFNYDLRDNVVYPLRGKRFEIGFAKLGLLPSDNVQELDIAVGFSKYFPLTKRLFSSFQVKGKTAITTGNQPFYNVRGLGYGSDLVRGYELYVIDGHSFSLTKANIRYKLFDKNLLIPFIKVKQFNKIPFQVYPNAFFDTGYVWSSSPQQNNSLLANKLLLGGGVGLDFISYYNMVMKLNYSLNSKQESGVYFSFTREF